jgi:hypothetical protein
MGRELSPQEHRWPRRGASSQRPLAVLHALHRCDVYEQSKETTSRDVHYTQSAVSSHFEMEAKTDPDCVEFIFTVSDSD